jgi:hypothetical protein
MAGVNKNPAFFPCRLRIVLDESTGKRLAEPSKNSRIAIAASKNWAGMAGDPAPEAQRLYRAGRTNARGPPA